MRVNLCLWKLCEIDNVNFHLCAVDLCELVRELLKAADEWFTLGVLFGIDAYELKCLKKQFHCDPKDCLTNMLMLLLDNTEVTWPKVIEIVWVVGCKQLARDFGKKYGMKESSVLSIAVIDLSCPDHC